MKTISPLKTPRWLAISLHRLVRALAVRFAAGQALSGMMANPAWHKWAEESVINGGAGGNGDMGDQYARIAALYAEKTISEIERKECSNI